MHSSSLCTLPTRKCFDEINSNKQLLVDSVMDKHSLKNKANTPMLKQNRVSNLTEFVGDADNRVVKQIKKPHHLKNN